MQERSVTLDGTTHRLSPAFMVIATQNPVEQEGTYPLPEAQLDRFLLKLQVGYPGRDQELEMVRVHGGRSAAPVPVPEPPVADRDWIVAARAAVAGVELREPVSAYIVDLVRTTREHQALLCGASPRSVNMLARAARAMAALDGTGYVVPDHVKQLCGSLLAHRVILSPAAEIEGQTSRAIVQQIVEQTQAPR
jgi:MoxR-like ATPase